MIEIDVTIELPISTTPKPAELNTTEIYDQKPVFTCDFNNDDECGGYKITNSFNLGVKTSFYLPSSVTLTDVTSISKLFSCLIAPLIFISHLKSGKNMTKAIFFDYFCCYRH